MRLPLLGIGLCAVLFAFPSAAQTNNQRYAADNYRPTTPGAYSLLKYVDNPTDLYHGMPQISVPIYTLQVGKKSFPLAFSYHAGGVRVTEEASWVGLGWDLSLPTVVQAINDEDDLTPNPSPSYTIPRRRPDWPVANSAYTIALPKLRSGIASYHNGPSSDWSNPYPGSGGKPAPETKHYYKSFWEYYVPVNTNFNTDQQQMFTAQVDSEPDIFTIDLFGTTLQCSRDFATGSFTVLNNNAGIYSVSGGGSAWYVTDGDGYSYEFTSRTEHKTAIWDVSTYAVSSSGSQTVPSMVVWYLSSITSPDGHHATFTYAQPYPERVSIDFKQKCQWAVRTNTSQVYSSQGEAYLTPPNYYASGYPRAEYPTRSYTYETKTYLQSVTCDNIAIDFFASARQDIGQAQQLDSIRLYDPTHVTLLKRMQLTHDYFQATTAGATFSTLNANGVDTQRNDLRLRLTALTESTTGTYQFTYDAEPLPLRNSFAQDFWGYYNGATSNISLVPSTQRLGIFTSVIPDNGNNNGAVLQYARAGTLTGVRFPTGGRKQFEYELNTYDSRDLENNPSGNAHLPDYDSLNNKFIKGNGLRVKRIVSYPVIGEPLLTEYTYYQGRTMLPKSNYRSIVYDVVSFPGGGSNALVDWYTIYEINSSFQYSPALIGSGTGVGYGRVEERRRHLGTSDTQPAGTTVYYYTNQPDVDRLNDTGLYSVMAGQLYAATQIALPACQNPTTKQNGLVDSVKHYNDTGRLLRKTIYTYRTLLSAIDYGVKQFSGGVYYEGVGDFAPQGGIVFYYWNKGYLGYYPIYGKRSNKLSETTIDYGADGGAFVRRTAYTLDNKDRVVSKQDQNYPLTTTGTPASFAPGVTYTYTYPDVRQQLADQALIAYHRLNEPVVLTEVHAVDAAVHPGVSGQAYTYEKYYNFHSPTAGLDSVVETTAYPNGPSARRKVTRYKKYDSWLRPAQITTSLEGPTAYIWYDQLNLPTAIVKNAPPTTVLCTSFEPGQLLTGWSQLSSGLPGGVTGGFCQSLSNGLTSPSLPSGSYAFSYWVKGYTTMPTVTGAYQLRQHQTASRADGWVQYQGTLTPTGASAGTVALQFPSSATGQLDEVRLHPVGAQMVSFTYGPWQTITSQTDAAGRISLYEYDTAGRLARVRDEQGRILTQEQYHYVSQP